MTKDKVPAATDAATQEQDVHQFIATEVEQPLRASQPEPESS
jgi:alpha-D-ribose 1-methylphosphonate 5-triphosphate synthase subunit PhnG